MRIERVTARRNHNHMLARMAASSQCFKFRQNNGTKEKTEFRTLIHVKLNASELRRDGSLTQVVNTHLDWSNKTGHTVVSQNNKNII